MGDGKTEDAAERAGARGAGERRQRLRLEQALDQASDAILIWDADGRVVWGNAAWERFMGLERKSAVGHSIEELAELSMTGDRIGEINRVLEAGDTWQGRLEGREGRVLDASITAVRDDEGRIQHYLAVTRDVTREVELETRLRRQQKLEAIGTLASGVAHDFNNLLTAVLGHAELLSRGDVAPAEVAEAARVIGEAARRGSELTGQLLGFGLQARLPSEDERVDVHQVIAEVARLLSRTLPRSVSIQLDLAAPRSTVRGDPGQLQQVFLNLAVNARDAMPEGGTLLFATERAPGEGPPRVAVRVRDTGVGIAENLRERIFEPFFTTKQFDKGTGMGLAVVYGIVQSHGGSVSLESRVGAGTTFEVALPLAEEALPVPDDAAPRAPLRGVGRVLVVDDDAAVRRVAGRMLRFLGYDAALAADGAEAVRLLRADPTGFDLVLLDLDMPEMDGRACLRALRAIRSDLPVILSTGLPASELGELAGGGRTGILPKPYDLLRFSEVVAKARR
jgi:two-component system, cell cycle sensor histidine kinase and response regulator CckA